MKPSRQADFIIIREGLAVTLSRSSLPICIFCPILTRVYSAASTDQETGKSSMSTAWELTIVNNGRLSRAVGRISGRNV